MDQESMTSEGNNYETVVNEAFQNKAVVEEKQRAFERLCANLGPILVIVFLCNIAIFSGFVGALPQNIYEGDIDARVCSQEVIDCVIRPNHECCGTTLVHKYCYFEGARSECVPLDVTIQFLQNNPGNLPEIYYCNLAFLIANIIACFVAVVISGVFILTRLQNK